MLAGGSTMTFGFQAEEKIKSVNVYMIYAKPEPSYDITGYYNNEQGSRKSLFINGKPRELVGADSIRLSKDTDVYLSQFKGKKYFLFFLVLINVYIYCTYCTFCETYLPRPGASPDPMNSSFPAFAIEHCSFNFVFVFEPSVL